MSLPKLIVHIGAGKTGSSSIQRTLAENRHALNEMGCKYLGLFLEYANESVPVGWDFEKWADVSFARDSEAALDELHKILSIELSLLASRNVHTAIWSNEWMFDRPQFVLPVLERLRANGYNINLLCYVRRHDKWVRSAYAQWGIKHKTYRGRIQPFGEWRRGRSFAFLPKLKPWMDLFPRELSVFNYDHVGDVVSHFCKHVGIGQINAINDNETPTNEVLAVWAVFNDRRESETLPMEFQAMLRRAGLRENGGISLPGIQELLPGADDLEEVRKECAQDREALNRILEEQGEPPLDDDRAPVSPAQIDPWRMNELLLRLIFSAQDEISDLRARVMELENSARAPSVPDDQI